VLETPRLGESQSWYRLSGICMESHNVLFRFDPPIVAVARVETRGVLQVDP